MKLHAAAIGLLSIALSGANAKQGSLRDQNERVLKKKVKRNNAPGRGVVASTNVEEPVECILRTVEPLMLNPEDEGFVKHVCVMDSANEGNVEGIAYELNEEEFERGFFESYRFDGQERMSISSAVVEKSDRHGGGIIRGASIGAIAAVQMMDGARRGEKRQGAEKRTPVNQVKSGKRDLSQKTGTSTLLVLYAIPPDYGNDDSPSFYANSIFGNDGDPVNVRSQASACSRGQLEYVPAEGSDLFVDGVLEVPIDNDIGGVASGTVVNWVTAAAQVLLAGSGVTLSQFTQVMHIIPSEANWGGAAAWAYLPGSVSAFQDQYSYRMGVQLHEFGHNIGLHHSGFGTASYADHSCIMGNPSYGDDGPQICWNAAKSWESTWYEEDSVTVTPSASGESIELVGVADWVDNVYNSGTHRVVLQILDSSIADLDYYVIYNRAKGPNSGVNFAKDQVTISTGAAAEISWHQAGLDAGELFRKAGYNGGAQDLVVKVCEMSTGTLVTPDSARVLIYLDDGPEEDNGPSCDGSTPPPSPSAPTTLQPTPVPTKFPTNAPTPAPTAFVCDTSANDLIEVDITTDPWPNEISWELFNICSGDEVLLDSNNGLSYTSNSAQPTDKTCNVPGGYLFRIKDGWGDGITGSGGYQIKVNGTIVIPKLPRGNYDEQEHEFGSCLSPVTPPPTPNPTSGETPPPTPNPTSNETPPPTPNPTSVETPPPTPNPTSASTTSSPTFLSCSQHNAVACVAAADCQWLGTCHNCGCVLQAQV